MNNGQNRHIIQFDDFVDYGKLPPQAIEIEEAVLGSIIIESDAIIENHIMPDWFYSTEHQEICRTIIDINNEGRRIDLLTVTRRLMDTGKIDEIGGPVYLAKLVSRVASAGNIKQYIHILQDKYTRRESIRLAYEIQRMAYDETVDVEDLIASLHNNTLGLMEFRENSIHDFSDACQQLRTRAIANIETKSLTGIDTGFTKLNRFTGGWQGSDLVVVAGETSQGKTSLVMNFAMNAALSGIAGVIYSLEMSLLQLTARLISGKIGISSKRLMFDRLAQIELHELDAGISRYQSLPIYTDDNVNNSIESICTSIRRMVLKYRVKYAIVDYIQNIREIAGKNEEGSLGSIVKMLKNLAKELNITIFAVSQLSRNKDKPAPTISRLRGSGQIEETADIILMIYRPEYYSIKKFTEPYEEIDTADKAMITIGKGRNIGTGNFIVDFDKTTTTFKDVDNELIYEKEIINQFKDEPF